MEEQNPGYARAQKKSKRSVELGAVPRRRLEKGLDDLRKGRLVKAPEDYTKYLDKPA